MTQERLQEIKHQIADYQRRIDNRDMFDNIGYMELLEELISAVEELQRIPQLIQQIFEAGGDLTDLYYSGSKYIVFEAGSEQDNEFDSLITALEFILERTKENVA